MNDAASVAVEAKESVLPGIGLDVGTMNFVAARMRVKSGKKEVITRRMRDAFLDFPLEAKKRLRLSNVNYVEVDDELVVVGDAAIDYANLFGKEARRPLQAGLISPREIDAIRILGVLVKHVLKEPQEKDEYCYFSTPAMPVDDPSRDVIYHKGVMERIITECGFRPVASNEALSVIYSETAMDGFSGIGVSMGAGMTNVSLVLSTVEGLSFSVGRGGDWIDAGAARSIDSTAARMCALKEKGINLMEPESRAEEALAVYYKAHIEYVLEHFVAKFDAIRDKFAIPKPIPLVVSGGTSLVGGFMDFFKKVFEGKRKKFPIEISEVRHAENPLNAVAQGLLIQALQEYEPD